MSRSRCPFGFGSVFLFLVWMCLFVGWETMAAPPKKTTAQEALRFYGAATGRTLIYGRDLQLNKPIGLQLDGINSLDTIGKRAALRQELAKHEIVATEVGNRILFVVHPVNVSRIPRLPSLAAKGQPAEKAEVQFSFENVPVQIVLDLYGELTGRKFVGEPISGHLLNMETPGNGLGKKEATAAIEALVLLHNLRIIPKGTDNFVVLPSAALEKQQKTVSPKP